MPPSVPLGTRPELFAPSVGLMGWEGSATGEYFFSNFVWAGPQRTLYRVDERVPEADQGTDVYSIVSNVFDAGTPTELKRLTKAEVLVDTTVPGDGSWVLSISADNGPFESVLSWDSAAGSEYAVAEGDFIEGRTFQYELRYVADSAQAYPLRAVRLTFSTGEMVDEWQLMIDATEFVNVDNVPLSETEMYGELVTLASNQGAVEFVDNFQGYDKIGETRQVKVVGVDIVKDSPAESYVRVTLRSL